MAKQNTVELFKASKLIIYINEIASKISRESNQHFVSTVGKINVVPNSDTIIPGYVFFTIDLRTVSNQSKCFFKSF